MMRRARCRTLVSVPARVPGAARVGGLFRALPLALPLALSLAILGSPFHAHAADETSRSVPEVEEPALALARNAVRKRDFEGAVRIWREAAHRGSARAQYRLGVAYRSGRGVERDPAKAARWFIKAAEGGDADAQYALGLLHQHGLGVESDRDRALELIGLAARRGHREAKKALAEIQSDRSIAFATADARVAAHRGDPRDALNQAIRLGDVGAAREALARGAPIDGAPGDQKHWRPLILAIEQKQVGIVDLLFEHGANPNRTSRLGEPPLILAIRGGQRPIVRRLLARGAAANARSLSGYTPLMEAARLGHSGIVDDLLKAHADPKTTLADGTSAADVARRFRFKTLASRLQRAGAPALDRRDASDRLAVLESSAGATARGSQAPLPPAVEAARRGDAELLREMASRGIDLGIRDPEGDTALHRAAEAGHPEATRILLSTGVPVNARGNEETTALMRAMASEAKGSEQVVAVLLEAGADPHLRDRLARGVIDYAARGATVRKLERLRGADGSWTPADVRRSLERAAAAGRVSVVDALLGVVASPDDGLAAVCGAIGAGQDAVVERVLASGVGLEARCADGSTPLMIAAHSGRGELVVMLLKAGAAPGRTARNGDTALIAAAGRGHAEIVTQLLAAGADIDQRGAHRSTALMAAAAGGHAEATRILLEARADRRMRSESDQTALDLAKAAGHPDVATLIESSKSSWRSWMGSRED